MGTGKKNRNLFRLSRFILLRIPFILQFLSKRRKADKKILIICNDAIGDYILCRNFIEVVRNSKKFSGYQLVLLGNKTWEDLAIAYDSQFIDEFIFIKPEDFYHDPVGTGKLARKLYKQRFETVLVPCSTRRLLNDGLAGNTCAKHIIGYISDHEAIFPKYKKHTDKFYSRLIDLPADIFFEFDRNKFFFESVLEEAILIDKPVLPLEKTRENHIIIAPGSGRKERNWEFEKFKDIITRLLEYTNYHLYLIGGASEISLGEQFKKEVKNERLIDLTGQLTLTEFVSTVSKASLVIANETSIIHIANACEVNNVYILGGGHYKRFAPYPVKTKNLSLPVYNEMICYNCNWSCIHDIVPGDSFPCISAVTADEVWKHIKEHLLLDK